MLLETISSDAVDSVSLSVKISSVVKGIISVVVLSVLVFVINLFCVVSSSEELVFSVEDNSIVVGRVIAVEVLFVDSWYFSVSKFIMDVEETYCIDPLFVGAGLETDVLYEGTVICLFSIEVVAAVDKLIKFSVGSLERIVNSSVD